MHSIHGEHSASYLRNQNHQHSIWRESFSKEDQIIIKEAIKNYFSTIISPDFLSISDNAIQTFLDAKHIAQNKNLSYSESMLNNQLLPGKAGSLNNACRADLSVSARILMS